MIINYGPKGNSSSGIDFNFNRPGTPLDILIKYGNNTEFEQLSPLGIENIYEFYQEGSSWILIFYKDCNLQTIKTIKNIDIGGIGGGGAGGETTANGGDPDNNYQTSWEEGGGGGAGGQRVILSSSSIDKNCIYTIKIGQGALKDNGTSTYIKRNDQESLILEALGGLKGIQSTEGNKNGNMLNSAKGGQGNSWTSSSPDGGGSGENGAALFSNSYFSSDNQKDLLIVGGGGAGAGGWYKYTQGGYGNYGNGIYGRGGKGANKSTSSEAGNSGLLMIRGKIQ